MKICFEKIIWLWCTPFSLSLTLSPCPFLSPFPNNSYDIWCRRYWIRHGISSPPSQPVLGNTYEWRKVRTLKYINSLKYLEFFENRRFKTEETWCIYKYGFNTIGRFLEKLSFLRLFYGSIKINTQIWTFIWPLSIYIISILIIFRLTIKTIGHQNIYKHNRQLLNILFTLGATCQVRRVQAEIRQFLRVSSFFFSSTSSEYLLTLNWRIIAPSSKLLC